MTPAEPRTRAALSYDVRKSDRLARMPPIIATDLQNRPAKIAVQACEEQR